MSFSPESKSYKLISVNTSPERAMRLVGQVIDGVSSTYSITHCGNASNFEEVAPLVEKFQPDLLFCASMWSPAESDEIKRVGREIVPGLKCYAVPQGLRTQYGPEAVVQHVVDTMPGIIDGDLGRS